MTRIAKKAVRRTCPCGKPGVVYFSRCTYCGRTNIPGGLYFPFILVFGSVVAIAAWMVAGGL